MQSTSEREISLQVELAQGRFVTPEKPSLVFPDPGAIQHMGISIHRLKKQQHKTETRSFRRLSKFDVLFLPAVNFCNPDVFHKCLKKYIFLKCFFFIHFIWDKGCHYIV